MNLPPRLVLKFRAPHFTPKMSSGGLCSLQTGTRMFQISDTKIADILELCAGVFTTQYGIKGERSGALKEVAELVKSHVTTILALEPRLRFDASLEFELGGTEFDKRTKRIEREEKVKAVTKKASSMKASMEKVVTCLNDKELDELQAKLKEVEQIIGQKRKVSEADRRRAVNGRGDLPPEHN